LIEELSGIVDIKCWDIAGQSRGVVEAIGLKIKLMNNIFKMLTCGDARRNVSGYLLRLRISSAYSIVFLLLHTHSSVDTFEEVEVTGGDSNVKISLLMTEESGEYVDFMTNFEGPK